MANGQTPCKNQLYIWWIIKVVCGVLLITSIFDRFFFHNFHYHHNIPIFISQLLVVLGAFISIYHYNILKSTNQNITKPTKLIVKKGLFPYIRHPMYFGDIISYFGFFSFSVNWVTAVILPISYVALFKQARDEDANLEKLFGYEFCVWADQSKLLVPFIK